MRILLAFFTLGLLILVPVFSQQIPGGSGPTTGAVATPVPYEPEEFAPWLRDLNRGKNIAFGAFPFTYLLASLGYDIVYYANQPALTRANFAPWPVGAGTSKLDQDKQNEKYKVLLLSSAGISILVSLADYFLGLAGVDDGGIDQ